MVMVARRQDSEDGKTIPHEFCVRLTIAPIGRQRSAVLWVCHAIQQVGGSYMGDGRFSLASERQRRIALKVLSDLFDPRFFEPVDSDAPPSFSRG
jgi:hypothetical protein